MNAAERTVDGLNAERDRRKDLEGLKEELAQRAAKFLGDGRSKPGGMGYSQIRNLVSLTQTASSVLEIEAFIDYQMGRDNDYKSWRCSVGDRPFGEALKDEIEAIEELALKKRKDDRKFVLLCLTYYFGYLAWRAKYLEYAGNKKTGKEGSGRRGRRR